MALHQIRGLLWLALALGLSTSAQAGLEICNDTSARQRVAIGYKATADWSSTGWWDLAPQECSDVVAGALRHRFYYLRVETEGWEFQDDKLSFCVDDSDFRITGDTNCALRGHRQENFARIDTGIAAVEHSHRLSANLIPGRGAGAPRAITAPEFSGVAVFQDCQLDTAPYVSFCTFIGAGRRFLVYDDSRIDPALWQQLAELPQGRRVAISGQRADLFDTTSELVLRQAVLQPVNAADRLLARLQGTWRRMTDPDDSFRVSGAERVNTYAGAETSVEYLSIQDHCGAHSGQGPYLFTWANTAGTHLCYRLEHVSGQDLSLVYLPQGTTLRYHRDG
ncbi:DUF1036 domain-containing protein [Epibacterium sp. MM17-32]|uniref:DUF1036 domain-containing protein n=1 Tax=Epibacterium sp. MM17-32 TaxID=2917734 RepID=UPI001EF6CC8B|nr:DUF1036 domain-containing protein [Epibacterium sp. MM17-32]MCG7627440.1 DUF1036 domain-containing protein [Epibacterium sp. MM17-32]